jgi:hypothetical protein
MKNYQKQLLKKMHYEEVSSNNEPLKNVKEALGKVAFVKGNPLTKTEIKLNVQVNFFKNQQAITPTQLPVGLQGQFPVYLLGLTDFYSGFPKSEINVPLSSPWISNLNYSYHEGVELVNQSVIDGWGTGGYWNVIPVNYVPTGTAIQINAGAGATIIKNNFAWLAGHVYKISFNIENDTAGFFLNFIADGVNFFVAEPPYRMINSDENSTNSQTYSFYYIPTNKDLQIQVIAAGATFTTITGLSIKEVFGNISYPSDNSLGIYGYNKSFCLSNDIAKGDLVQTYNYILRDVQPFGISKVDLHTAEVIIHCNNVAFGTFLNSFVSDLITINTIRYIVPIANVNQFINPIKFGYQTLFGKTYTDDIDPRNYITSRDFQQQIADIPINLPIDKAVMVGTQINFDCQTFDMILFVEKVEPLTHK